MEMKTRKVISSVMLLAAMLIAISIIVMHTVAASTPNDAEVAKDDGSEAISNSNENDLVGNNGVLMLLSLTMIILTIIGIYLGQKKVSNKKEEVSVKPEIISVEPFNMPDHERYDYDTWCSSSGNWSKVNSRWIASDDEPGPEYGSYSAQYNSLYDSQ
jgi:hypothetical protein